MTWNSVYRRVMILSYLPCRLVAVLPRARDTESVVMNDYGYIGLHADINLAFVIITRRSMVIRCDIVFSLSFRLPVRQQWFFFRR